MRKLISKGIRISVILSLFVTCVNAQKTTVKRSVVDSLSDECTKRLHSMTKTVQMLTFRIDSICKVMDKIDSRAKVLKLADSSALLKKLDSILYCVHTIKNYTSIIFGLTKNGFNPLLSVYEEIEPDPRKFLAESENVVACIDKAEAAINRAGKLINSYSILYQKN